MDNSFVTKIIQKAIFKDGHWMMFFEESIIDHKWEQVVKSYRQGKLTGVHAMKVSTARENFTNSENLFYVIVFYCGPSDNQNEIIEIGKNLLQHVEYANIYGYMYYTDLQTFLTSQASGDMSKCKYKIEVPKGVPELPMNLNRAWTNPEAINHRCSNKQC